MMEILLKKVFRVGLKPSFILLIILLALVGLFLTTLNLKFKEVSVEADYQQMLHRTRQLYHSWTIGESNWMCEDFFDPSIRYEKIYFKCNVNLLKCKLKEDPFFSFKKIIGTPSHNRFGIVLSYQNEVLEKDFIFYDTCKNVKLPEGIYGLGEFRGRNDFVWENKNGNILFDRTLVARADILHWPGPSDKKRREELHKKFGEKSHLHYPAVGLSLVEMKNFCRFHGKKLMEAHVWDAASFIPEEKRGIRKKNVVRTPYFWMKGRRGSFLDSHETRPLDSEDCVKAYVKECQDIVPLSEYIYGQPSWIGMFQILGGVMEALDNPFRPGRNLVISNRHLSRKSPWHRIGRRGYWDGKGLKMSNMNFGRWTREDLLEDSIEIGFRCMTYD